MIVNNRETVDIEKSTDFKKTSFRIDQEYMNKMMWLTINQYAHKIRTPVQEIISNARDAHREAGKADTPIKITLPTKIDPTFKVRDFGVGLSPERVKEVFTSFGASTKSTTNEQTGGFGIGAKSPLTYTDQFNVVSYYNGTMFLAVVSKNEDGGIDWNEVGQFDTEESNGVEIQIPVGHGDAEKFVKAAYRCTIFWDVQPIFNLSTESYYQLPEIVAQFGNVSFYKKENAFYEIFDSNHIIVVDGIPYEANRELLRNAPINNINASGVKVYTFNTGDIGIIQTRESIKDCSENYAKLSALVEPTNAAIDLFTSKLFEGKGLFECQEVLENNDSIFNLKCPEYAGLYISSRYGYRINWGGSVFNIERKHNMHQYNNTRVQKIKTENSYDIRLNDKLAIVYDDVKNEAPVIRNRRLRTLLKTYEGVYLISREAGKMGFVRQYKHLKPFIKCKLSEVEQTKIERARSTEKREKKAVVPREKKEFNAVKLSYNGNYSNWYTLENFPKQKVVYTLKGTRPYSSSRNWRGEKWRRFFKDSNILFLALTQKNIDMIKDLPNVETIESFKENYKPSDLDILNELSDYKYSYDLRVDSRREIKFFIKNKNRLRNDSVIRLIGDMTIGVSNVEYPEDLELKTNPRTLEISARLRLLDKLAKRLPRYFRDMGKYNKINEINKLRL